MIKNNVHYEFFASYTVPDPSVGYWVDLGANSKGKIIKVYNPNIKQWVKLTDATSDDAVSPFIGSNGNWWVDNRDTGISASGNNPYIGDNCNWYLYDPLQHRYTDSGIIAYGKTAYDFAIESGFVGTEEEFKQQLIESVNAATVANEALDNATEMIENPPKIINGRWWFYDITEDIYKDSGISAVGDAFTIVKTYRSITDMQNDYNGTEVRIGQFVMIDTGDVNNEEDSRLYLKGDTEWKFISDLSGAQGIQGLSAYQVAVQNGFIGTESEWLQSLKQPALDAANEANTAKEQVLSLATEVTNAEAIRNTNENTRINAERTRVNSENIRVSNEADRQLNETIRETQEASRKNDTAAAINAVNQAKTATEAATVNAVNATNNANTQADRAKEYADNPPKIQSGYWYTYDDTSSDYASTNVKATGDDGVSATVTVGTVTTLPANDAATVTNTGTSTAAILNFGIPKGNSGVESFDLTKYINANYTVKEGTLTDTEYQKFSDAYASNINVGVITIDNGDTFTVLLNWQVYDNTDSSYFYCYFYGAYSAIEDTGTRYGAIIINKSTKAYSSLMNPYSFVLVGQGPNGPQLPDMDLTDTTKITKADIEQVLIGNITTHHHDSFYISKTNGSAYTPTMDYNPATKKYVDDAVAAINVNQDGTTVNKEYIDQQLTLKVDKVAGKQLSTNDYTTTEKNKLSGIAAGAEVNVNADWNATSGDAQILNKPTLSTVAITNSYNDLNNKPTIITEEQIDQKINTAVSTAVGSVYKVKGSVANYAALPTTDVAIGDVYNLTDTGANYVATSTTPTWDKLSETVDLSRYLTKTEASSTYQPIGNYLSTVPSEYVTDSELNAKGYATTSSVTTSINGVNQSIEEVNNKFGNYTTTTDMNTAINNAVSGKLDASIYTATDVMSKVKEIDGPDSGLDADTLDGVHASSFALKTDLPSLTQAQQNAILVALNAITWVNGDNTLTEEQYNAIVNAIPSTTTALSWHNISTDDAGSLTSKQNYIASAYFKIGFGDYEFYAYHGYNDARTATRDSEPSVTCFYIKIYNSGSNHIGTFNNYSISLKRSGTGSTYLADDGQYHTPSVGKILFGTVQIASSLSNISPIEYSIKVSLTSASTLSFAYTPYEGYECMIDIKNTGSSAIEQSIPTGSNWQSNVDSITIESGKIGSISVRYIHDTYLVTAVGS